MPTVVFDPPSACPVLNHLTGSSYQLMRADKVHAIADRLREIIAICNQPVVYAWLFKDRLGGRPYGLLDASAYFTWWLKGWRDQTHFVFFIVTASGEIAAACDIKSNETDGAEIGYWASSQHRGITTNAVMCLCGLARDAGFKVLSAKVKQQNLASARVLERAGFIRDFRNKAVDELVSYSLVLRS